LPGIFKFWGKPLATGEAFRPPQFLFMPSLRARQAERRSTSISFLCLSSWDSPVMPVSFKNMSCAKAASSKLVIECRRSVPKIENSNHAGQDQQAASSAGPGRTARGCIFKSHRNKLD
jgi:hypothetical protein